MFQQFGGELRQQARNQDVIYDKKRGRKNQVELQGSLHWLYF